MGDEKEQEIETWRITGGVYTSADSRVEELEEKVGRLEDRIADIEEAYQKSIDSPCPDEKHCTCVPALMAEIERLRAEIKEGRADYWRDRYTAVSQAMGDREPKEGWRSTHDLPERVAAMRAEIERLRASALPDVVPEDVDALKAEIAGLRTRNTRLLEIANTAEEEADERTKTAWAEIERLRAELEAEKLATGTPFPGETWVDAVARLEAEVERLRAELRTERLLWQNTMHAQALEAKARPAKVVEAAKQLFTSIETIERQAEVLARRVQDDRPVETILFECKRTRAAFALAAAQPEEEE